MAPPRCAVCKGQRAEVKRPRTGQVVCKECFFQQVEEEVHETIVKERMFNRGDVVASGASGGKDSTVLIHLLTLLNTRYDYGLDIRLVSIDEGIVGYRDDSLATVQDNAQTYGLPLHVLSYQDLFGWTMDEIVKVVGLKNNCTYCGVLRRQALERGAVIVGANVIATGHNADDNAETFLMNILRADIPRLTNNSSSSGSSSSHSSNSDSGSRTNVTTTAAATAATAANNSKHTNTIYNGTPNKHYNHGDASGNTIAVGEEAMLGGDNRSKASPSSSLQGLRRVKPMKHLYQKDIVMYAYHKKLVYFTTECTYAQEAYRGTVRNLIKQLEAIQPQCIAHIIRSSEAFPLCEEGPRRKVTTAASADAEAGAASESGSPSSQGKRPRGPSSSSSSSQSPSVSTTTITTTAVLRPCSQCGAATNQTRCRACVLLASLEKSRRDTAAAAHRPNNNGTPAVLPDSPLTASTLDDRGKRPVGHTLGQMPPADARDDDSDVQRRFL